MDIEVKQIFVKNFGFSLVPVGFRQYGQKNMLLETLIPPRIGFNIVTGLDVVIVYPEWINSVYVDVSPKIYNMSFSCEMIRTEVINSLKDKIINFYRDIFECLKIKFEIIDDKEISHEPVIIVSKEDLQKLKYLSVE